MRVAIEVKIDDALKIKSDILVLKFAQNLFGVDAAVVRQLSKFHADLIASLPRVGECLLVESYGSLGANNVLFVGVKPLWQFGYQEIREFARRALGYLAQIAPNTKHLCLTLHGVEYGLDETEAFESEIAGCVDAVASGHFPQLLEHITIVEIRPDRAERLSGKLLRLLPDGAIKVDSKGIVANISELASERFREVGYSSDSKPFVFVAMPFNEKMDDVFHYGISGAVNKAGFLCERADLSSFTGDIMEWVKRRIKNAKLVIADLTTANPNVYLEVGYAWGCGIPTILIVQDTSELKFDVRGQRCLAYKSIKHLEEILRTELENLQLP
jgi:hypothetical protein